MKEPGCIERSGLVYRGLADSRNIWRPSLVRALESPVVVAAMEGHV